LKFNAKLLLFGEYSVLMGSDACAFPLEQFSGRLVFSDQWSGSQKELADSKLGLKSLFKYLSEPVRINQSEEILDLHRLESGLNAGIAFQSNIPINYGIGSSGALVAAVYHTYKNEFIPGDLASVRAHLAFIESAFHTASSGTDPLVSYLNRPVFIRQGEISNPDISLEDLKKHISIELVDSNFQGMTKSGIGAFQSGQFNWKEEQNLFNIEYIPLVNDIVSRLFTGRFSNLMDLLFRLSALQLSLFPDLFTPSMRDLAHKGLESREFALKLCGSGGGGFYLKLSPL
jgi:mevalonate kinase